MAIAGMYVWPLIAAEYNGNEATLSWSVSIAPANALTYVTLTGVIELDDQTRSDIWISQAVDAQGHTFDYSYPLQYAVWVPHMTGLTVTMKVQSVMAYYMVQSFIS